MKIVIAKRSGLDTVVYINASRINSFHACENPYDGRQETKIYFTEGKCEIEGDKTQDLCWFMSADNDSGILDLVNDQSKLDRRANK